MASRGLSALLRLSNVWKSKIGRLLRRLDELCVFERRRPNLYRGSRRRDIIDRPALRPKSRPDNSNGKADSH